ncbi:protein PFC0760c-like protein [Salvia divinorum]|uniref:Protein PFC0760c-like protein n=1 Tax=Salvia divinorum TaxID=28513 RepID=A0ABD1IN13_SALDI
MDHNTINNNNNSFDEDAYRGVGIHSQVTKVKLEMEKINRLAMQQPEERPPLHRTNRQHHRSRSPLGLAQRPISVGN